MKAKFYIITTVFLLWFLYGNSQKQDFSYRKSTQIELNSDVKNDLFLLFNFENRFSEKSRLGLGYKLGLAATVKNTQESAEDDVSRVKILLGFPFQINYFIGKENKPSIFEIGYGITLYPFETYYFDKNYSKGNLIVNFSFIYRYQPVKGGFTWFAGYAPVINTSKQIMSCFSLGIGKTF